MKTNPKQQPSTISLLDAPAVDAYLQQEKDRGNDATLLIPPRPPGKTTCGAPCGAPCGPTLQDYLHHLSSAHWWPDDVENEEEAKRSLSSSFDGSRCHVECGKSLSSPSEYKRHFLGVHADARRFGCFHCERRYVQWSALKRHLKVEMEKGSSSLTAQTTQQQQQAARRGRKREADDDLRMNRQQSSLPKKMKKRQQSDNVLGEEEEDRFVDWLRRQQQQQQPDHDSHEEEERESCLEIVIVSNSEEVENEIEQRDVVVVGGTDAANDEKEEREAETTTTTNIAMIVSESKEEDDDFLDKALMQAITEGEFFADVFDLLDGDDKEKRSLLQML